MEIRFRFFVTFVCRGEAPRLSGEGPLGVQREDLGAPGGSPFSGREDDPKCSKSRSTAPRRITTQFTQILLKQPFGDTWKFKFRGLWIDLRVVYRSMLQDRSMRSTDAMFRKAEQATANTVQAVLVWKLICVYLRLTHRHNTKNGKQFKTSAVAMFGYAVCDWVLL